MSTDASEDPQLFGMRSFRRDFASPSKCRHDRRVSSTGIGRPSGRSRVFARPVDRLRRRCRSSPMVTDVDAPDTRLRNGLGIRPARMSSSRSGRAAEVRTMQRRLDASRRRRISVPRLAPAGDDGRIRGSGLDRFLVRSPGATVALRERPAKLGRGKPAVPSAVARRCRFAVLPRSPSQDVFGRTGRRGRASRHGSRPEPPRTIAPIEPRADLHLLRMLPIIILHSIRRRGAGRCAARP